MNACIAPTSEAEACALVREQAAIGGRLLAQGGGTQLPDAPAVTRISSRALQGVVHYQPDDFTVTVAAGTPCTELTDALAREGQRLPFEVHDHRPLLGTQGTPTIGAVAASDLAGCARQHLLGARLINGRGDLVRCGSRALKNVAGLDLSPLVVGSRGSLGLITEVVWRVECLPERALTVGVHCSIGDALRFMARARALGLRLRGGVHLNAAALGGRDLPAPSGSAGLAMLRFEGRSLEALRVQARRLSLGTVAEWTDTGSDRVWGSIRAHGALCSKDNEPVWHIQQLSRIPGQLLQRLTDRPDLRLQLDLVGGRGWARGALSAADQAATRALCLQGVSAELRRPGLGEHHRAIKRSFDPAGVWIDLMDIGEPQ